MRLTSNYTIVLQIINPLEIVEISIPSVLFSWLCYSDGISPQRKSALIAKHNWVLLLIPSDTTIHLLVENKCCGAESAPKIYYLLECVFRHLLDMRTALISLLNRYLGMLFFPGILALTRYYYGRSNSLKSYLIVNILNICDFLIHQVGQVYCIYVHKHQKTRFPRQ